MKRDRKYFDKKLVDLNAAYSLHEKFKFEIYSYKPGNRRLYQLVIIDKKTMQEIYSIPGHSLGTNDFDYYLSGLIDADVLRNKTKYTKV